jgi:class 3 adenylate cyclase
MAQLTDRERSRLPDSAFAYIDARGRRRLPIHDEAHVRNALARFSRTTFEDEEARQRAQVRLLKAARKYKIVPVGFMTGQLQPQRTLPEGVLTFLLADIEGSTALLTRLADRYPALLADLRNLIRRHVRRGAGREVDVRADELFAVFTDAPSALSAAVAIQRAVAAHAWPDGIELRIRIGIHTGRPKLTSSGYVGLAVHAAARICSSAHGAQIVVSHATLQAAGEQLPKGITLRGLGSHVLHGLPNDEELFQVVAEGLLDDFPPPRTGAQAAER